MDNETRDSCQNLEFEYWAIRTDNENWDATLSEFLKSRGIAPQDAKEYSKED